MRRSVARAANADELHEALLLIGVMTEDEIATTAGRINGMARFARQEKRASGSQAASGPRRRDCRCCRAIYRRVRADLAPARHRSSTIVGACGREVRELVRGRIEVCGPITVERLDTSSFKLQSSAKSNSALLALEAEGFVLRGTFHPTETEIEWCDRRLLARIHRLTIHRLRAEIEPVSLADFQRFLVAWQRAERRTPRRRP